MFNFKYIFLLLFLSFSVFSQDKNNKINKLRVGIENNNNDTIKINKLYDISSIYPLANNKKIDSISNLILHLSKKNNFQKGFGYYYLIKGKALMKKENYVDYNKALSNFKIASSYFSKLKKEFNIFFEINN